MTEVYERIVERALALAKSVAEREPAADYERRAWRLLDESMEHRATLLANVPKYRTPRFADWLIDESFALRYQDPVKGVRLARLAVEVADNLPQGAYRPLATDLKVRALAYLGNAYRTVGDLAQAEEKLRKAREAFLDSSCEPLLAGEVAKMSGGLAVEVRDFPLAYRYFKAAFESYSGIEERHHGAEVLVLIGRAMMYDGADRQARAVLGMAAQVLKTRPEPELLISLLHTFALSYAQTGEPQEGSLYARLAKPLYQFLPGDLPRLRCCWLEATILSESGPLDEAREILVAVRDGFRQRRFNYDAALVSLDLSLVLLKQRKWAEVESLARESYAAFAARGLSDRATAALLLFVDAAKQRTLAEELVKRVAGEIRGGQREAWAAELASR